MRTAAHGCMSSMLQVAGQTQTHSFPSFHLVLSKHVLWFALSMAHFTKQTDITADIDSADRISLADATGELFRAASHPQMQNKPLMLVFNKSDLPSPVPDRSHPCASNLLGRNVVTCDFTQPFCACLLRRCACVLRGGGVFREKMEIWRGESLA